MIASLPTNLIILLNRFEFDVKRSRRIKINTPILLTQSVQIRTQDGYLQGYDLYAVVIHTGESANHGHYYTYARDSAAAGKGEETTTWLLYNDTSIAVSSFEEIQQTLAKSRTDTPYMLFFRKMGHPINASGVLRSKRSASNL
ncbi:Ubiquitin carboxyl-terminal hydrolase 35 [Gamsiella multidivaricata]|nr:Ubiquitin carboxyl-terminal hydrolase 35 [Gamsiella multidivaricata]